MNDVDRWFERTAGSENRVVSLYPSLLTGRIFAYFRYRLRYPLLLTTARFAVHVAEFFLILATLGGIAVFTVMVLRLGSLIVGGGWWGLLEIMRERLRTFSRSGGREASEQEIGRWLVLSVILALITTAAAGAALALWRPSGDDPVAHLYAFLVVVELAINFPVRVLHSGVFATRRVYRPAWAMYGPTILQLGVLGLGFYFYPAAAIIIAIIASNAIGIWVTVHFSRETYRLIGIWPRFVAPVYMFWRLLPKIPPGLGFMTTLSGFGMRVGAVLTLALVGLYGTNTRSFDLAAADSAWQNVDGFQFFYLIVPLFRATYDGAGIFYFDFVRLRRIPAIHDFRILFFHRLLWITPIVSLYHWSLAAALGLLVLHDIPLSFLLALIPLFMCRSVIGIYQMRLFAEGRFGTFMASLAFFVVSLWLVWIDRDPASDLIQITAAMIAQIILLMNVQHLLDRRYAPLPALLALRDWIRTLTREPGPLLVGRIAIPESVTAKQKLAVVTLMEQTFDGKGHVAFRSPTALFYYERTPNLDSAQRPHLALHAVTGGAATRGSSLRPPITNGRDALERMVAEQWLGSPDGSAPDDLDTLRREFRTLFAGGIVVDLRTLQGTRDMRDLDQGVLATALPAAIRSLEDGTDIVSVSGRWLTPIYHRGTLRLLFVLPPAPEPTPFKGWLDVVKAWHGGGRITERAEYARNG